MIDLSRRGFLAWAALALGEAACGCSSVQQMAKNQPAAVPIYVPSIELSPFSEYHPFAQERQHALDDRLLGMYITEPLSINELLLSNLLLGRGPIQKPVNNPVMSVEVSDMHQFETDVLRAAAELGYTKQAIQTMPIHDAVLTSGKIVAHQLDYAHGMISDAEKERPESPEAYMYLTLLEALTGIDKRNEMAKQIDNAPDDIIFAKRQGICRNYAGVNAAVFSVLKKLNPGLKNTYMRYYSPEDIGHSMALPHAWNMVTTLEDTAAGKKLQVTYVDPTWLDTRRKTARNDGEMHNGGEEEMYNALDNAHFGEGSFVAQVYLAQLYEALGYEQRMYSERFTVPRPVLGRYLSHAFQQRIGLCERLIQRSSESTIHLFQDSFRAAVEDMTHKDVSIFLKFGNDMHLMKGEEVENLRRIYTTAMQHDPLLVTRQEISLLDWQSGNGQDKDKLVAHQVKISPDTLFRKVMQEYTQQQHGENNR
ncbi:hypothetical protein HY491_01955 [Candidatus Woesearchaeota archaeon]|nr:hypothetical protein [Candidatus Woesearchaeota archaeon]